jgi:hypothetical protein
VKLAKAVDHGVHGEHSEQQDLVRVRPITGQVTRTRRGKPETLAVAAVFAVVQTRFSTETLL